MNEIVEKKVNSIVFELSCEKCGKVVSGRSKIEAIARLEQHKRMSRKCDL